MPTRMAVAAATLLTLVAMPAGAGELPTRSLVDIIELQPDIEVEGPAVPVDAIELIDPRSDAYHPLGDPGFTPGAIDITRVSFRTFFIETGALDGFGAAFVTGDGVVAHRPPGLALTTAWLAVSLEMSATTALGDAELAPDYCEYLVAWRDPNFPDFDGIEGDLFDGTNRVSVARTGAGVDGPVEVRSLTWDGSSFSEFDGNALFAASGMSAHFVLPLTDMGEPGMAVMDALPDPSSVAPLEPLDMNFGAFCSRGGRNFAPENGGADIVREPIDLTLPPVFQISEAAATVTTQGDAGGPPEEEPATSITATTMGDAGGPPEEAPPTTGPAREGEGGSSVPLLLLLGGAAGAALFFWWWYQKSRTDDPYGAFRYRLDLDGETVGGFSDVVGLETETDPIDYRSGTEATGRQRQPGLSKYTNISLERGVTGDIAFWNWVVAGGGDPADVEPRSGAIRLLDEKNAEIMRWDFDRGWPTKWEGPAIGPNLDEVPIESLDLRVEGLRGP